MGVHTHTRDSPVPVRSQRSSRGYQDGTVGGKIPVVLLWTIEVPLLSRTFFTTYEEKIPSGVRRGHNRGVTPSSPTPSELSGLKIWVGTL